jgi:Glycosyl hydrolase family 92/NPCBM-associated, NEW3 domain of alpha-galactosidase
MAFHVPQDGRGLANLYGGTAKLADKLDQFFATPETATFTGSYGGVIHEMREARDVRMGQYGHSNQPSHHIIYMYDYAGQPWKAQQKVREALSRLYLGSEIGQGYPGDEDNGEMSAWYVFSALGFYPLQMGSPYYAIGSPLFTKATVHLENGKDLVISAPNNSPRNVYVQGLTVNGKKYDKTYLPHDLLANGGTLQFTMGARPSSWGTGTGAAPPSITQNDQPPAPLHDATGAAVADPTVAGLFDDNSGTQVSLPGSTPSIPYHFAGDAQTVSYYTLTSGAGSAAEDPSGWVLEGSTDGQQWTVLDQRSGETFPWRSQTRPFKVHSPGRYIDYRLRVTGNGGAGSTSLAEVELLNPAKADTSPLVAAAENAVGSAGDTVGVRITVSNYADAAASGQISVTGPAGWTIQPATAGFGPLAPGGSQTVTAQVTVPAGTAPGTYPIAVTVTSDQGSARATSLVTVIGDLIEFTPGTAAEQPWLFDADASQLDGDVYDGRARFTDGNSYATYRFQLPGDVTGGTLTLDIGNQFLVQTSTDNQNWRTILDETNPVRDLSNRAERSFDLNGLRDDGQIVYLRIADSQPADGWGAWLARVRITLQRTG